MKAAVIERYGPPEVVRIKDVPKPMPADNEVLIRVRATTVNSGDARVRGLRVPRGVAPLVRLQMGFSGPKQPIAGFEVAGEVEAVGGSVTRFKPGDRVVGSRGFAFGCHAEYICVAEDGAIATIPESIGDVDAVSLLFGGVTSFVFFRLAHLKRGETILINGASGAVGVMAVQIAKLDGVGVTGVCSTANVELVSSLGADRVIDYKETDFTGTGETWDLIMENVGNAPFSRVKGALKPGGRYLMVIGDLFQMIGGLFNKQVIAPKGGSDATALNAENFRELVDLAADGKVRPVVDSTYRFEDIVKAHARVDTGRKVGSVVVTLD
jgi:NADPH:quinone reductase-like Zn-dependent oxidoreductase